MLTVQADVGPGNETGIYYITICNLPFGTTWQKLKDWIRRACVVDHIEVFQSSTSGWVRVKGFENFEKAWGLLNGGIFNGRSIIASDRNRNHSIKIRELATPRQVTQIQTQRYQPAHPTHHAFAAQMAAAALYSMPPEHYYMTGYSPANGPRFASHSIPQGYAHQPPIVATTAAPVRLARYQAIGPGSFYAYGMGTPHNTVAYVTQHQNEGMQTAQPYPCLDEHSDFYSEGGFSTGEPSYKSEYIATETRKLHVSPFPQQAAAGEVKAWIRRKVDKTKLYSVEIPKNSNSRYLRGYVLVVFDSAPAANTARQLLNKARFQGRRVIARPAREGAAIEQTGLSHEATARSAPKLSNMNSSTAPRDEDSRKDEKPLRAKNREVKSAGPEKKGKTEKRSPLPSKKTAGPQTDKESPSKTPSSNRELGRKDEGPVIVDGTCHLRGKK